MIDVFSVIIFKPPYTNSYRVHVKGSHSHREFNSNDRRLSHPSLIIHTIQFYTPIYFLLARARGKKNYQLGNFKKFGQGFPLHPQILRKTPSVTEPNTQEIDEFKVIYLYF